MIYRLFPEKSWNIKQRFSIAFSLFFSLLLALVLLIILTLFSGFRKEEFVERLIEKAETTVQLLVKVKEVDQQLLKIIDQNTIHKLYNEKTLVFDEGFELIYSSIDDAKIEWSIHDLKRIKKEQNTYKKSGVYDVVGISYSYAGKKYFVIISSEDRYGQNKLKYLKIILLVAFFIGVSGVWLLSFYLSQRTLHPLDVVTRQIREITEKNLNTRLTLPNREDEITLLAQSFNHMIEKIEHSYKSQREFTGNASHELRTPLARIISQMENVVRGGELDEKNNEVLRNIIIDSYHLSDVVTSLLLLSRLDNTNDTSFKQLRLDEVIFDSIEYVQKMYTSFKIHFEILNNTEHEFLFNIKGDDTLLVIAFTNLLKNAYNYSDNKAAEIKVIQTETHLEVEIKNTGELPLNSDLNQLFTSFKRGTNTLNKPGSGLGLSIVKRIMNYHRAEIDYKSPQEKTNLVVVKFKI